MRMVMLNTNFLWDIHPTSLPIESIFCCQVFRMQIVSDRLGVNIKQALKVLNALTKGGQRLQVLQVANMVADKSLSPLAQAKGVLEMHATGQEGHGEIKRQGNRLRGMVALMTEILFT